MPQLAYSDQFHSLAFCFVSFIEPTSPSSIWRPNCHFEQAGTESLYYSSGLVAKGRVIPRAPEPTSPGRRAAYSPFGVREDLSRCLCEGDLATGIGVSTLTEAARRHPSQSGSAGSDPLTRRIRVSPTAFNVTGTPLNVSNG